jgi:NAD(P)-dependent dehydrogenase (short-subunit alcohol dehydrogenase family)
MLSSSSLIKKGIRINCTLPGPTQTPMTAQLVSASGAAVMDAAMQPINRYSLPSEQAGPLVFLNSDAATYVNGVAFPVDGGFMGGIATGQIDLRAMMKNAS